MVILANCGVALQFEKVIVNFFQNFQIFQKKARGPVMSRKCRGTFLTGRHNFSVINKGGVRIFVKILLFFFLQESAVICEATRY